MKLSPAQKRFLTDFTRNGYSLCPGGYARCNIDAAAWWRTVQTLQRLGLVKRSGQAAYLTFPGLAWTVAILRGEA